MAHLPFVVRSAELSNDEAAERRQRSLTLFVGQLIPKEGVKQRDGWARGGTTTGSTWDMGLLLASRIGKFESTEPTEASQPVRLWARSPNSVKAQE